MDDQLLKHIIDDYRQFLGKQKLAAQSLLSVIEEKEEYLNSLIAHNRNTSVCSSKTTNGVAISDGNPLSDDQLLIIQQHKFDGYDIVLNISTRELFARIDPTVHSSLVKCSLKNIGNYRIRLLKYMLEHPFARICSDNVHKVNINITDDAFKKAISIFRKVLQPNSELNSYIQTQPAWGESNSKKGCVYTMNQDWHYLVIRKNMQISL